MPNMPPLAAADALLTQGHGLIALLAVGLVIGSALLHYEALNLLSFLLVRLKLLDRRRVLLLILGLLAAHVAEVGIYAAAYAVVDGHAALGSLVHIRLPPPTTWVDCIYFSFVTYTTLGYGDLVPEGPIRFIAATEALNGWVLLGWSVSFTFLEMQRLRREAAK